VIDPRVLASAALAEGAPNSTIRDKAFAALIARLNELGLTFEQVQAIAKANGIELSRDGHIVAEAFGQLGEVLGINIKLLTTFGKSLDEQRKLVDAQAAISNVTRTPTVDVANELLLLSGTAPKILARFFEGLKGIDAESEEGRAKFRAALQKVLDAIVAGTIPIEDFGELMGKDELLQIILNMANALNEASDAADKLTDSLLNVPAGFKVNLAQFRATTPINEPPGTTAKPPAVKPLDPHVITDAAEGAGKQIGDTITTTSANVVTAIQSSASAIVEAIRRLQSLSTTTTQAPGETTFTPRTPITAVTTSRELPPSASVTTINETLSFGPVTITVSGRDKDAGQFADDVTTELRRRRHVRTGRRRLPGIDN
jgi:hypothetical protein